MSARSPNAISVHKTCQLHSSHLQDVFEIWMVEGTLRIHLDDGVSVGQTKFFQILSCLALVLNLESAQTRRRCRSLLLSSELVEDVVADLVVNTGFGILAAQSCLAAHMKV